MDRPDLDVEYVTGEFRAALAVKEQLVADTNLLQQVASLGQLMVEHYRAGHKALLAGNGGSAADAQHIAAEFVSRFNFDRPGLPAMALTTDTSILTAVGNDYGYEQLFRRQLEANAAPGDVFIAISTSGNSPNILEALHGARDMGITTLGLTGATGGAMRTLCDHCVCVPSNDTPRIQEAHILIGHTLCAMVERALFELPAGER
ncbi:MAG: D-sedoheptulose 7-phosphate isomerase [Pseudomonadota bacterium]